MASRASSRLLRRQASEPNGLAPAGPRSNRLSHRDAGGGAGAGAVVERCKRNGLLQQGSPKPSGARRHSNARGRREENASAIGDCLGATALQGARAPPNRKWAATGHPLHHARRASSSAAVDGVAVGGAEAGLRRAAVRRIRRNRMGQRGVGMSSDFSLFERHVDALYRSALRLTRKPEDAEDLVQETYLRAYRYRNRFKPGTNEKAWLFTIMTNVFRNRLRQRPAPEDPIDQPGTDFSIYDQLRREGMPVHLMSPEEIIVERGFADEVKRALEELPLPMRMVVLLVDVEDFSYKEVASILGIKIGTVMSRLHRGRQALQKKLWEYTGRPKARPIAVGAR